MSISLNGQQYVNDKILHFRDIENTFTYYQPIFIKDFSPKAGPTSGKTRMKVSGMGFNQLKGDNRTESDDPIWIRFIDYNT